MVFFGNRASPRDWSGTAGQGRMESGRRMRRIKARQRLAGGSVCLDVWARKSSLGSVSLSRFFVAFGLVALMASFGVESFLADCLAVGQEVVERVPTGKFEISVASRMHKAICWNPVSWGSFELVGADAGADAGGDAGGDVPSSSTDTLSEVPQGLYCQYLSDGFLNSHSQVPLMYPNEDLQQKGRTRWRWRQRRASPPPFWISSASRVNWTGRGHGWQCTGRRSGPPKRSGSPSSATSISAVSRLPAIHSPPLFRILAFRCCQSHVASLGFYFGASWS